MRPRARSRRDAATSAAARTPSSRTSQLMLPGLDVEADLENVTVPHLVILTLDAELLLLTGLRPGPDPEQLLPVDDLGADEAPLQVAVDHARALGRLGPRPE